MEDNIKDYLGVFISCFLMGSLVGGIVYKGVIASQIQPNTDYTVTEVTHKRVKQGGHTVVRYEIKACAEECVTFESETPKPLGKTMRFE